MSNFRSGLSKDDVLKSFATHLAYSGGRDIAHANGIDLYQALALSVRDRLMPQWLKTQNTYEKSGSKQVNYLSLEFLLGRALSNNMVNLNISDAVVDALKEIGLSFNSIEELEVDAGLGNGGLGRLAACFLDSLATLEYPAYGYGIRYEFGIFRQTIEDGWQTEHPDEWLKNGFPWEVARPEVMYPVRFGGHVEILNTAEGKTYNWVDAETIYGMAYDVPIVGYGGTTVNTLRLWSSIPSEDFDFQDFNQGDYIESVKDKMDAENISKVLYPNDELYLGKELRLKQQYFFVTCSLHDIITRFKKSNKSWDQFSDFAAIQLNDTHPSIAVAELMRMLIDEEHLAWERAWDITVKTLGYTNHTLMPEALEKWPTDMMERLLPRHMQIIYEINHRFLEVVSGMCSLDDLQKLSIIEEGAHKQVRMANLAIIGSHATNGVAALHSDLIRKTLVPELAKVFPERFNNKTNGITQRRWLLSANPKLAELITKEIGDNWITDLSHIRKIQKLEKKTEFLTALSQVKRDNKVRFAQFAKDTYGWDINPDSIFDVQIKRIHEYKRQLLNALQIMMHYLDIKRGNPEDFIPRTYIIGGKSAPGYKRAKLIIKLINNMSTIINNDSTIQGKIKLYFLPNYRVSLAEKIIPATDVSEQISTAGTEASGTGNMKFMINGALTLGTLDGANIEIAEEAGFENTFIFGLNADGAEEQLRDYRPWEIYNEDEQIKECIDTLFSDRFSLLEPGLFSEIKDTLLSQADKYLHLADLKDYYNIQRKVEETYKDQDRWMSMVLHNIAGGGKFSSDRTIHEYAREIWNLEQVPVSPIKEKDIIEAILKP